MGSQSGVGDTSMPKPSSLSRQGSLYSLTLDEVQNQLGNLGKPLSSMNLDELLRSVWTVETNNNHSGGSIDVDNGAQNLGQDAHGSSLNGQSSFPLSRDLSKKTVDEVWREIQQCKKRNYNSQERNTDRQNTLGEMTLEDFLVQAGVVVDAPVEGGSNNSNAGHSNLGVVDPNAGQHLNVPLHAQWMSGLPYPLLPQQQQHGMMTMFMPPHSVQVQQPIPISGGAISDSVYSETQMAVSTSPLMGTLSDTQTVGRKRVILGDVVEKTVERRQKRMIKNRESAARSRARKQAYTHELENKVSRLEEENERLRRMREIEKALPSVPPPQPKYQLRRTSSAPF